MIEKKSSSCERLMKKMNSAFSLVKLITSFLIFIFWPKSRYYKIHYFVGITSTEVLQLFIHCRRMFRLISMLFLADVEIVHMLVWCIGFCVEL